MVNFITCTLGISLPNLGLKSDPFGCCVITALGGIGTRNVTGPHNLVSRVPILISINKSYQDVLVIDG